MTKYITINGEQKTAKEWSDITGVEERLIKSRIRNGWSENDAVNRPKSTTVGRPKKERIHD